MIAYISGFHRVNEGYHLVDYGISSLLGGVSIIHLYFMIVSNPIYHHTVMAVFIQEAAILIHEPVFIPGVWEKIRMGGDKAFWTI